MKRLIFVILGIVVLIGVGVVRSMLDFSEQENRMGQFDNHINAYLALWSDDMSKEPTYRRGRVVTVDVESRKVDHLTYPKLAETVRATSLQDVGTVALIKYEWERIGDYVNVETKKVTGAAYKSKATVVLHDFSARERIGAKTFIGNDPVKGLHREGDFFSQQPMFEIVEFLQKLPNK